MASNSSSSSGNSSGGDGGDSSCVGSSGSAVAEATVQPTTKNKQPCTFPLLLQHIRSKHPVCECAMQDTPCCCYTFTSRAYPRVELNLIVADTTTLVRITHSASVILEILSCRNVSKNVFIYAFKRVQFQEVPVAAQTDTVKVSCSTEHIYK
jgi:hypothetical protein